MTLNVYDDVVNPLNPADIADVIEGQGTRLTVVKVSKTADYRVLKLAKPLDRDERKLTPYLLELKGRFYPCPTIASAKLWADNRDQWLPASS